MAKLYFNYGTMNSSKTLQLLATAYGFQERGIEIVLLKPSKDTRDGNNVIRSRAGLEMKCTSIDDNVNIYDSMVKYNNYMKILAQHEVQWVFVDECQFLSEEQVNQLSDIVDYLDINVMCYGLRTDFMSHLFPASKRLFEIADDIKEIKSLCNCGKKSSINARFDEKGKIITNGNQILIGGNDTYHAICRKCWKNKIKTKKVNENG
jgi:thymidine kinase